MISSLRVFLAVSIFSLAASAAIAINSPQTGDLTEVSPDIQSYGEGVPILTLFLPPGCPRPPCGKGGMCTTGCPPVSRLQQVIKVATPSDILVVFQPTENDILLKALTLEIHAAGKVVSRHELKRIGQEKPFSPVKSEKGIRGYPFALDQVAAKFAGQFFLPKNTIVLKAEIVSKGGGTARFYLVNAASKLPNQYPK